MKQLLDAWPTEKFEPVSDSFESWLTRLLIGEADGCDFGLHHHLVRYLIEDNFKAAIELIQFAGNRTPRLRMECLCYGEVFPQEEFLIYKDIFSFNDLDKDDLVLAEPPRHKANQVKQWIEFIPRLLEEACPAAYHELKAFRPIWLLASVKEGSRISFGGYSSSLALGTIALNVEATCFGAILIQVLHELGHQILFAMTAETPLVFNKPEDSFRSPLRQDMRPMDGVVHASFVSARLLDVLGEIERSKTWQDLSGTDQSLIRQEQKRSYKAAQQSIQTIATDAKLSALGERVVGAINQTIRRP